MKFFLFYFILFIFSKPVICQNKSPFKHDTFQVVSKPFDSDNYYLRKDIKGNSFTGFDTMFFYCYYNKWLCEEDSFYCRRDTCLSLRYYLNGNLIYDYAYFIDGAKRYIKTFEGYEYSDTVLIWYRSGNIECIQYPRKQMLYGCPMVCWYENGTIKEEVKFDDSSKGIYKSWYSNGQLKKESQLRTDGTISGHMKSWCENGVLKYNHLIDMGKQLYEVNNCEQQRIGEGFFVNALWNKVGRWRYWYDNGQLMLEEFYQDTDDPKLANYRIGTWSYWDENGNLIKQEIYKDNILVETKEFLPKATKKQ